MDTQALPVINSVAPTLPLVAQPSDGASLALGDAPTAPISSSSRSMAGQTGASFTTVLSRQATASTDSLINSLLDVSASPTPATRAKRVTTAATTAASGSASTPPAAGPLKGAPSGNKEVAGAGMSSGTRNCDHDTDLVWDTGIKRLDANMGAVSSRIEGYISDNDDRVAYLTANLKRVSDDVAATGLGSTVGPTFTASNMLAHPTILALITANNSSVDIIDGLRAKTASLRAEVTELHAAKRKRDVDEAPTYFVVGKLKWAGSLPKEHRRSRTHTRSPTIVHVPPLT
ncbi:hypothetical protein B0H10DRAFT_1959367 [Mycena sp. CBHHK59/15]|nr:hypothetical protein B0H10DRAFT_1959367 [Mycena sp. CBHHK59/15]